MIRASETTRDTNETACGMFCQTHLGRLEEDHPSATAHPAYRSRSRSREAWSPAGSGTWWCHLLSNYTHGCLLRPAQQHISSLRLDINDDKWQLACVIFSTLLGGNLGNVSLMSIRHTRDVHKHIMKRSALFYQSGIRRLQPGPRRWRQVGEADRCGVDRLQRK